MNLKERVLGLVPFLDSDARPYLRREVEEIASELDRMSQAIRESGLYYGVDGIEELAAALAGSPNLDPKGGTSS